MLPRDPDGYVDVDTLPDEDVALDLRALGLLPPLPEDVWDAIVGTASQANLQALATDTEALVMGMGAQDIEATGPSVGVDQHPDSGNADGESWADTSEERWGVGADYEHPHNWVEDHGPFGPTGGGEA